MKTKYQKPNTKIIEVKIHNLMNVSGTGGNANSVTIATDDYSGGTVLSRRGGSSWDDEEE